MTARKSFINWWLWCHAYAPSQHEMPEMLPAICWREAVDAWENKSTFAPGHLQHYDTKGKGVDWWNTLSFTERAALTHVPQWLKDRA